MNHPTSPPGLETRFTEPEGWRWHSFKNPAGKKLRFGTVAPQSRVPDAVVIGLQGLGEFTEKYFEVARNLVARNYSFWMLDWRGQGRSDRHLSNPHKRHSNSFDDDVADLHFFLMEYVKHSAVHPDVGRIPLVMLAHSMGGNIGLRYLLDHPGIFAGAAFCAPMTGIKTLSALPRPLSLALTGALKEAMDQSYLEFGGKDWRPYDRDSEKKNIYSSDPVRRTVHNAWCLHDRALPVGNITYGWLHEANLSCARLFKKDLASSIAVPCLFALAGQEKLVDNAATRRLARTLPQSRVLELPESRHEILMECDSVRNAFLSAFFDLLAAHNVKDKLKPF